MQAGIFANRPALGSVRRLFLLGNSEFRADERLNAFGASEPHTHEAALLLKINVKVEKGAALFFGDDPLSRVGDGNILGTKLEFVAFW